MLNIYIALKVYARYHCLDSIDFQVNIMTVNSEMPITSKIFRQGHKNGLILLIFSEIYPLPFIPTNITCI